MTSPIEQVQLKFAQSATWRRGMGERFPNDTRNTLAAKALERFAQEDAGNIRVDVRERIATYRGQALNDATSQVAREIEFKRRPKNLTDCLLAICDTIETKQ